MTAGVALLLVLPWGARAGGVVTTCTEAALRAAMAGGGKVTFACDGTIDLASTINIPNSSWLMLDATGHQVTISGNNAVRVFCINTNVSFTLVNLTIADGFSQAGSAILNVGGNVSLSGVTFSGNVASADASSDPSLPLGHGGAVFNRGCAVVAADCTFENNWARAQAHPSDVRGGGIRNESGQVSLQRCVFSFNQAMGGPGVPIPIWPSIGGSGYGGAVYNSGALAVSLCSLTGNSAIGGSADPSGNSGGGGGNAYGGGLFNEGTVTVDESTFSGNTAGGGQGCPGGGVGGSAWGGGVCSYGVLSISRSTLSGNGADGGSGKQGWTGGVFTDTGRPGGPGGAGGGGDGGALYNSGTASLVNCTIAGNCGQGGGWRSRRSGWGRTLRWSGGRRRSGRHRLRRRGRDMQPYQLHAGLERGHLR